MIHFALLYYSPNTASLSRMRGYWDAMEVKKIDACVTFLQQYDMNLRVSRNYNHIQFRYYNGYTFNKLLSLIAFWIHLLIYCGTLKKGDVVYTYGINKVTKFLLKVKGVRVVAEITEHPSISDNSRIISINNSSIYEVAKKLDSLIVISEPLKKDFETKKVNGDKIKVINMTVNPSRFTGLIKNNSQDRYISYCGTASNNKDGVNELIKAFFIVSKLLDDVKLRIIGKTPSETDESGNLQMIKSMGIEDRIEFTGQIPFNEVPQLLMDSDVLALDRPDSLQAQCGFPTKLGEYLLTGNPVVVTKVGDIPLFLKDGKSALLAEERNAEDFAGKLLWALNHPIEASVIGQKGKEVALKHFNSEIETEKLIEILQA